MAQSDTVERILDAAEQLFAERGFAETSLRLITTRAGVNLAAVNYHFGSKKALIQAVFSRFLDPFCFNLERDLDQWQPKNGEEVSLEALLNLLAEGVNPAQQVDGAARVHAIETLKGLESDVEAGSHVAARLAGSTVWENCKGQRHDLFLATGGSGSLMLTGPSSLDVGNGPQRSTL